MSNENTIFAAFIFVCITAVIGLFGLGYEFRSLKAEAVKRGYAEWYSSADGYEPTKWRWKESIGDK